MANKYSLELAIDAYRAQNGKDKEIELFEDGLSNVEYGFNKFGSREQAIWWLKQQKPNHEEIRKMIAEERKKYPNSGLNPLFEIYERYYPQVQKVQQDTADRLKDEKPSLPVSIDEKLRDKVMVAKQTIGIFSEKGQLNMGPSILGGSEIHLTGKKILLPQGGELVQFSKVVVGGNTKEQSGWVLLSDLSEKIVASAVQQPAKSKVVAESNQGKSVPEKAQVPQSKPVLSPKESREAIVLKEKVLFKDGAYYLTGPKGNTRRIDMKELVVNLNLPKDAPENLQKSVSTIQDFALVLDAYLLENPKEKGRHEQAIQKISKLFANENVQLGKEVINLETVTPLLFSNNTFLKNSDLYTINEILKQPNAATRHLAILQFIRDRLDQSDFVAQKLMGSVDIKMPSDEAFIKNKGDIGDNAEHRQKIADAIRSAKVEAALDWKKNYAEYEKRFKEANPGATWDANVAERKNEEIRMIRAGQREFVYQKLYNEKGLPEDKALLQDILGAGFLDMSDKAWDVSQEVAGMIAMEAIAIAAGAVTMGAGTVAINALALGRNAYRGARALEAYNAASKTRQVLTTSARILGGGVTFEAGAATTRSYLENGDFTSMHSKEGYLQSIAMMGVMRGLGEFFQRTGVLAAQEGQTFKNVLRFSGQVAIEGTAIFGTSATIGSVVFDRRDNWTLEQMAQAMLMATVFKGAGKIFARKGAEGNIEVTKDTVVSTKETGKYSIDSEVSYTSKGGKTNTYIIKDINQTTGEVKLQSKDGNTVFVVSKETFEARINGAKTAELKRPLIDRDLVALNQSLNDADRLTKASERLGRAFTEKEQQALLKAHNSETVMQKGKILAKEGEFSKEETRILMDEGYAGRRQGLAPGVSHEPPKQQSTPENNAPRKQANTHESSSVSHQEAKQVAEEASKTINQGLAAFSDKKAVKLAWDIASKELESGGFIRSVLTFPVNIMRLPVINTRKIMEIWFTKNEKGFVFKGEAALDKIGNSLKIAATSSSKPFEGKTQSMLTLATMGTVLWMTYDEISKKNPSSPKDWTWGMAVAYLKNMNITFPVEFTSWFFENKDSIANWFNSTK